MVGQAVTVADLITEVIDVREGGMVFTHDAPDPPTFGGVTIDTARRFYGASFTVEQLQRLTRGDLEAIYLRLFVIDPQLHRVAFQPLQFVLVDFGINSGPAQAVRELQRLLVARHFLTRHDIDGRIGPTTIAALDRVDDPQELADDVAVARALFCARLVQDDVNAFLKRFADLKRDTPAAVWANYFPTRKDELDYAAYGYGWIRRALASI
jgi:lysozyme family protein